MKKKYYNFFKQETVVPSFCLKAVLEIIYDLPRFVSVTLLYYHYYTIKIKLRMLLDYLKLQVLGKHCWVCMQLWVHTLATNHN